MKSSSHLATIVDKLVYRQREWLKEQSSYIQERETKHLISDIAICSASSLANISDSLGMLAQCYGAHGVEELASQSQSGWFNVSKSMLYNFWSLRFAISSFQKFSKIPGLTNYIPCFANLLCYAIVAEKLDWARWIYDTLVQSQNDPECVDQRAWKGSAIRDIAMRLFLIRDKLQMEPLLNIRSKSPLLENSRPAPYSNLNIQSALETHYKSALDFSSSDFEQPPFNIVPWEVIATCQLLGQAAIERLWSDFSFLRPFLPEAKLQGYVIKDAVIHAAQSCLASLDK